MTSRQQRVATVLLLLLAALLVSVLLVWSNGNEHGVIMMRPDKSDANKDHPIGNTTTPSPPPPPPPPPPPQNSPNQRDQEVHSCNSSTKCHQLNRFPSLTSPPIFSGGASTSLPTLLLFWPIQCPWELDFVSTELLGGLISSEEQDSSRNSNSATAAVMRRPKIVFYDGSKLESPTLVQNMYNAFRQNASDSFDSRQYVVAAAVQGLRLYSSAYRSTCAHVNGVIEALDPSILFVLSDEGHPERSCINDLPAVIAKRETMLTFRQYSPHFLAVQYPAWFHGPSAAYLDLYKTIMLGWASDQFDTPLAGNEVASVCSRPLKWGFAGSFRAGNRGMDRILTSDQALAPFRVHYVDHDGPSLSRRDLRALHNNSVFVPNRRGHVNLDCLRISDAIRAGAIPVIVVVDGGDEDRKKEGGQELLFKSETEQVHATFGHYLGYEGRLPNGWVFAHNWTDASRRMTSLLADPAALLAQQEAVLRFWSNHVKAAQRVISDHSMKTVKFFNRTTPVVAGCAPRSFTPHVPVVVDDNKSPNKSTDANGNKQQMEQKQEYSLTLLYPTNCAWERDYVVKEVFGADGPSSNRVIDYTVGHRMAEEVAEHITRAGIRNTNTSRVALVIQGFRTTTCDVLNHFIDSVRPRILLVLSDEGFQDRSCLVSLPAILNVPLVLRQYSPYHYGLRDKTLLRQDEYRRYILKYKTTMLGWRSGGAQARAKPVRDVCSRRYLWAFAGTRREGNERMEGVLTAANSEGQQESFRLINTNDDGASLTPSALLELYHDAVFVPSRRGNVNLDCLRISEAVVSGAIPVVVDESDEDIDATFTHYLGAESKRPPGWVFAHSWTEAWETMTTLRNNSTRLKKMQRQSLDFWAQHIMSVQKAIRSALLPSL